MENREKLVSLTKNLIEFKTTSDNYEEKKNIVEFVKNQFEGYKVYIKEFEYRKCPSIIITLKRERIVDIFLNGHLDVVPAKEKQFNPKITDSRIYGRGAGDMKASCSVMIEVIKYFSQQKNSPSIGLMLTTDEETGGANGVRILSRKYKASYVIVPDGGRNLKTIIMNQKGLLHIRIWTTGKSVHGARPFLGENAIDKLIGIYQKIKEIIPDSKQEDWSNTINLGKISGGEVVNKVPSFAEALLDIRFINSLEREKIIEGIEKITSNFKIINNGPSCNQEPNEFIELFKQITQKEIRSKVEYSKVEGASDARYFSEYQTPTLVTNIKSANIHANNEWVDIKQMVKFYNILIKFISQWTGR